MRKIFAGMLLLVLVSALPAEAPSAVKRRKAVPAVPAGHVAKDPFYQKGLDLYAAGRPLQALDAFRVVLHRHPGDETALAAVLRVEAELPKAPARAVRVLAPREEEAKPSVFARLSEGFDAFVLVDGARFLNFDDTLGDRRAEVGALEAFNGRVAQLLKERQHALACDRPFPKEDELRCLVRRLPAVLG